MATHSWKTNEITGWLNEHPEVVKAGLSQAATEMLFEMSQNHVAHERPTFAEVWLQEAYEVSQRSPDAQTQVGAVIISSANRPISQGYNGWMGGIDDSLMPNIRPMKHTWVIHAELNALLNCEHRPSGATLYCTHQPCLNCFFACVQAGISEVVYTNDSSTTNTEEAQVEWEIAQFLVRDKIKVRGVDFTPRNG